MSYAHYFNLIYETNDFDKFQTNKHHAFFLSDKDIT